jgi:hypothetical protein
LHRLDEPPTQPLDGVSARFVARFPGRHVPADLLFVENGDPDATLLERLLTRAGSAGQPHGGDDPVLAAGQAPQHDARLLLVARLPERGPVQEHERVGGKHPFARPPRRRNGGLLPREARGGGVSRLSGRDGLVDVGGRDGEGDAERGQDFGAARRGGGEDETTYG